MVAGVRFELTTFGL